MGYISQLNLWFRKQARHTINCGIILHRVQLLSSTHEHAGDGWSAKNKEDSWQEGLEKC